jgi:hypothetical protein
MDRLGQAFFHNFCPNVDRRLTWLRHPFTVLLAAALVSLLVGLFVHGNGYVLLTCIASILLIARRGPG